MKWIKELYHRLIHEEEGATATEYAVMLVLIIVVALGAITLLGEQVEEGFQTVADAIENANAGGGGGS
ncbi:MAG: Flp family type IVb pilin [Desulfuromonadales bacterium]|nr:Flp family type IVb pilin [Desulfuromonadales bacterium]